jgi:hypothetical protein
MKAHQQSAKIGEAPGLNSVRLLSFCCSPLPGRCFEVLGIDVMVDSQLRPWLIEFNHLPRYPRPLDRLTVRSFGTDSPLDLDIKSRLMEEVSEPLSFTLIP